MQQFVNEGLEQIRETLKRSWGPEGLEVIMRTWDEEHLNPPHSAEEAEDFFLKVE